MENNQRNSRKRLNSLILLVAFTAVMLIVSTYAWFSAQKNVTIGGLKGTVNVAEGLEISLDAKYWSQEVDFGDYTNQYELKKLYGATEGTAKDGDDLSASPNHNIIPTELLPVSTTGLTNDGIGQTDMNFYRGINQNGSELYDIITVQKVTGDGTDEGDLATTYTQKDPTGATTTPLTSGYHDYPGYYAIDLFLRNSTSDVSTSAQTGGVSSFDKVNQLQLNANSKLELQSSSAKSSGLQNTVRVAFALYNMDETQDQLTTQQVTDKKQWSDILSDLDASAYMTASQKQILAAYKDQTINDVAIWEPNASSHAQEVVDTFRTNSLMTITWLPADQTTYGIPDAEDLAATPKKYKDKFGVSTPLPTYALTSTATSLTQVDGSDTGETAGDSVTDTNTVKVGEGDAATHVKGIQDIYDWDATLPDGLAKQVTLQTVPTDADNNNYATGKVKQLVSVTADNTKRYTSGTGAKTTGGDDAMFSIPKGKVCKVRMYVWLEGQDPDTINHASHGGGIYLDVGLLKDGTEQS